VASVNIFVLKIALPPPNVVKKLLRPPFEVDEKVLRPPSRLMKKCFAPPLCALIGNKQSTGNMYCNTKHMSGLQTFDAY